MKWRDYISFNADSISENVVAIGIIVLYFLILASVVKYLLS